MKFHIGKMIVLLAEQICLSINSNKASSTILIIYFYSFEKIPAKNKILRAQDYKVKMAYYSLSEVRKDTEVAVNYSR